MRLPLDTHIALWALLDDRRLAPQARNAIGDPANAVYISAASVWEIAIKHALGRSGIPFTASDAIGHFGQAGYQFIQIRPEHARFERPRARAALRAWQAEHLGRTGRALAGGCGTGSACGLVPHDGDAALPFGGSTGSSTATADRQRPDGASSASPAFLIERALVHDWTRARPRLDARSFPIGRALVPDWAAWQTRS